MDAAGVGEGFERPGDVELALDGESRLVRAGEREPAGCKGSRSAALVDPAPFDRAGFAGVVEVQHGFAAECGHSRAELYPDRAAPGVTARVRRKLGPRDTGGDHVGVAEQGPDDIGRRGYDRRVAERRHGASWERGGALSA